MRLTYRHWELMFTRAMFAINSITRQHALLRRMAELVEAGSMIGKVGIPNR